MRFQFQCPFCRQILEAEPSQASQATQCPTCGNAFIIPPPPIASSPAGQVAPQPASRWSGDPSSPAGPAAPQATDPSQNERFPGIRPEASSGSQAEASSELLHIPCPHCPDQRLLETPPEMLGQTAMCPYCGGQLVLRLQDSVEHKRRRQQQREQHERKVAKAWLQWVIVLVVVTVLAMIALIVISTAG